MTFLFFYVDVDGRHNYEIKTLPSISVACDYSDFLDDAGMELIDYARIDDVEDFRGYTYEVNRNMICVLSGEILLSVITRVRFGFSVGTFDGYEMDFSNLQTAVTFASIYDYPPYDTFKGGFNNDQ